MFLLFWWLALEPSWLTPCLGTALPLLPHQTSVPVASGDQDCRHIGKGEYELQTTCSIVCFPGTVNTEHTGSGKPKGEFLVSSETRVLPCSPGWLAHVAVALSPCTVLWWMAHLTGDTHVRAGEHMSYMDLGTVHDFRHSGGLLDERFLGDRGRLGLKCSWGSQLNYGWSSDFCRAIWAKCCFQSNVSWFENKTVPSREHNKLLQSHHPVGITVAGCLRSSKC